MKRLYQGQRLDADNFNSIVDALLSVDDTSGTIGDASASITGALNISATFENVNGRVSKITIDAKETSDNAPFTPSGGYTVYRNADIKLLDGNGGSFAVLINGVVAPPGWTMAGDGKLTFGTALNANDKVSVKGLKYIKRRVVNITRALNGEITGWATEAPIGIV